ncbi:MAG: type II toxin-antitoxin system VapC family toxin [candidate division KSB1 bacterium]|nr:type II toxin-antitoxin system VapC family toxin [candidate division KSB1 bacterium]MDZ7301594.1 type II toxin-antitoxin system VapC family toxin [candidate division KSB1 bacterium]MDZ7310990.1 type II toxin-antitoxin system VapC family toxin [candidate division KSB1 bacterium]
MTLYVLDSDHLSLHQRGHEPLRKRLLTIPPDQIAITIISAEELLRGRLAQVRRATKPESRVEAYHWLSKTIDFLCGFTILKFDTQAEVHFQNLCASKIKIGTQDLKIGSIARSQDATLVTRNRSDFERIPSLKIEDWST